MVYPHIVHSCTLNLTLRGLITYVCLWDINLQSFNHLMGREIQNDMLPISLETCNNVGIDGDLLVKQFARSLQGNAFDW